MKRIVFIAGVSWVAIASALQAQPATTPTKEADNTARNAGERHKTEATAEGQSEKHNDRTLTQKIRSAVVKDKSLSVNAHNVKIIVREGKVTLRGVVNSPEEKANIEAKAAEIAGKDKVENKLDVKEQKP